MQYNRRAKKIDPMLAGWIVSGSLAIVILSIAGIWLLFERSDHPSRSPAGDALRMQAEAAEIQAAMMRGEIEPAKALRQLADLADRAEKLPEHWPHNVTNTPLRLPDDPKMGEAMRNSAEAARISAAMQEGKIEPAEALKRLAELMDRQANLLDDSPKRP